MTEPGRTVSGSSASCFQSLRDGSINLPPSDSNAVARSLSPHLARVMRDGVANTIGGQTTDTIVGEKSYDAGRNLRHSACAAETLRPLLLLRQRQASVRVMFAIEYVRRVAD